jgi:hypothetical protein
LDEADGPDVGVVNKSSRMPHRASVALAAFLCLGVPLGAAPLHVLFVGNSLTYVNDLPAMTAALAVAAGQEPPLCQSVVAGGYSLEDHWSRGDALRAIEKGGWDFVVLQQGPSASDGGRAKLRTFARLFAPAIRKAGARAALYMVWPLAAEPQSSGAVSDSYRLAGMDVGGLLVPVGEAWNIARKTSPKTALYLADGLHPTVAGTYLAALVFVGELYGISPVGLPSSFHLESGKLIDVPPDQVRALQEAARDAIAAFARLNR